MSRAVDLVIVGMTPAAGIAAVDAARTGGRVLVVDQTTDRRLTTRFRQFLDAADDVLERIVVLTGVEVVCVDGMLTVEAVLLRRLSTGFLIGINTRAVLVADDAQLSSRATAGGAA
jgi:hypothetical protein